MSIIKSKTLLYRNFGDPQKVLELTEVEVSTTPGDGEVLVEWLASPINPLDINRIMGQYIIKGDPPIIGGSEGIGRVVKTGPNSKFHINDHVTIFSSETPFWTEFGIVSDDELQKIDNRISIDLAATIMVNPPTAWLMIHKYVKLSKGDFIIQNSANSGVGRSCIEIAKAAGFKTINIVRNRENIEELKTELWKLGADHVFTEEEFAKGAREFIKTLPSRPKLALNGVGGRSVLQISSVLERGGMCITYGGMSKKAHEFSTSALVFNDITVKGIAVGMWARLPESQKDWAECLEEVQKLAVSGEITAIPMEKTSLDDYRKAFGKAMGQGRSVKQLFVIKNEAAGNAKI
ncbi:unnamed protein product [Caenorhabditis angaria]|uniref:Enoyl-[acyl-carrier-protein] reductase, mitochondrial n=1 Tax=Caenorhabditis angaria TaxID=860376 RepID=A0A9P1IEY5_9PELO|nr:unnamed protein product [Caenorhabditis angaria]